MSTLRIVPHMALSFINYNSDNHQYQHCARISDPTMPRAELAILRT